MILSSHGMISRETKRLHHVPLLSEIPEFDSIAEQATQGGVSRRRSISGLPAGVPMPKIGVKIWSPWSPAEMRIV